ncbi:MAG: zinc ribbon domain-containing protein [Candidatus Atabeyarchaeum deiterrae]
MRSKVICASLLVMIAIIPAITISASATTTIANTSVTLSQSAYYPWSYYCSRNDIIRVSFDVTSGGYTTFLIMSQYDYVLFVSSVPTYGYEVLYRYSYGEIFVWVAPTADTYYFVLYNSDSNTTSTISITITDDPGSTSPGSDQVVLAAICAVIAFTAVATIIGGIVKLAIGSRQVSRRVEPSAIEEQAVPASPERRTSIFCSNCGAAIPAAAQYCPYCGSRTR